MWQWKWGLWSSRVVMPCSFEVVNVPRNQQDCTAAQTRRPRSSSISLFFQTDTVGHFNVSWIQSIFILKNSLQCGFNHTYPCHIQPLNNRVFFPNVWLIETTEHLSFRLTSCLCASFIPVCCFISHINMMED